MYFGSNAVLQSLSRVEVLIILFQPKAIFKRETKLKWCDDFRPDKKSNQRL
jgi:hypothetical protein